MMDRTGLHGCAKKHVFYFPDKILIILNMCLLVYIYICLCVERERKEREFPQSRHFLVTFIASHLLPGLLLFTQGESGLCALPALAEPGTGNLSR